MNYIRNVFLDASALITWLLYHDKPAEPGGMRLDGYLKRPERQRYSNEPCLTGVLARLRWMRHHKEITEHGYFMRISLLKSMLDHQILHISKFNYWGKKYADMALWLTGKYKNKIDFIDAL